MPFFKKEQKAINGLWYPRTATVGHPVEMDEVCKRIAEMSTASVADSKAVLTALVAVLGSLMNTGRTVHIEGLGTFYYGCVAEGTGKETADEVTAECITATRVRFLPDRVRSEIIKTNRARISHYQHYTNEKWGEPHNYDLMVNTGSMPLQTACHLIAQLYKEKADIRQ